jgi:hypothetical protein
MSLIMPIKSNQTPIPLSSWATKQMMNETADKKHKLAEALMWIFVAK